MEHLIIDLKQKLLFQMEEELNKIQQLETGTQKEAVLVAAGKVLELEYIISLIDNLLNYNNIAKQ